MPRERHRNPTGATSKPHTNPTETSKETNRNLTGTHGGNGSAVVGVVCSVDADDGDGGVVEEIWDVVVVVVDGGIVMRFFW